MTHSKPLPRFIVTINDRFSPGTNEVYHPYGVSGFTSLLVDELRGRGLLQGMILYRRDALCSTPLIQDWVESGTHLVRFVFSFETSRVVLARHFKRAVALLRYGCEQETSPIAIYHQTPVLVPLTPDDLPFVVTHHGPIADRILSHFGREVAVAAFEGGYAKLAHLLKAQREGIEFLRMRRNGLALELSTVQAEALRSYGISSDRIAICPPSFYSVLCANPRLEEPHTEGRLHLIAAAARVDSFKRLDLLIETANLLYKSSIEVVVEIYAGTEAHSAARAGLLNALLPSLRERATITSCLAHDELIARFTDSRHPSIFVLTSIYETFGLTALESILAGNVTVVPDIQSLVGLTGMISHRFRYLPTASGLAEVVTGMVAELPHLSALGRAQRAEMQRELEKRDFIDVLIDCALMSCSPVVAHESTEAPVSIHGEHRDDLV